MAGLLDFLNRSTGDGQARGPLVGLLDTLGLEDIAGSKGLLGKFQDAHGGPEALRGLLLTLGGHDQVGAQMMGAPAARNASQGLAAAIERMYGGQQQQQPQAAPPPQQQPMSAPGMEAPFASPPMQSADMGQVPIGSSRMPDDMGSPDMPRGFRNANPLNIEDGRFAQSQPGYAGSDGRFAKFASMEQGAGAANSLLDVYQNKHGLNTIQGIISRWAPAGDGNNVNAYVQAVSSRLGIAPDAPLRPEMRQQLIAAMAQHENGRPMPQPGMQPPTMQPPSPMPGMQGGPQMAQAPQMGQRPQPAPMPPQNPMAGNIQVLLRALSNPALPAAQREVGKTLLQNALDGSKMTDEQKEYVWHRAQGGTESFTDWKTKLKRAGATAITVDQRGENEYAKQTAKDFAELNRELIKGAQSARTKIATLDRIGGLLQDPKIYTGASAEAVLNVKRLAKAIGMDVEGLGPSEAVRAISNQFALELRNPSGGAGMPGAMSDKDREFLQASVPGLRQNAEGNALIIDYLKRVAQRSIDVEKMRQQYVRKTGRLDEGFYRELEVFSDSNPLFPEAQQQQRPAQQQGGGPPVQGARQAPDGNYYIPDPARPGKYLMVR